MTRDEVVDYVAGELQGTLVVVAAKENGAPEVAWGDTFFIYDPDGVIPPDQQFPYATVVINDYPGFDEASNLARAGIFRVNVWVSRSTFDSETSGIDQSEIDYSVPDVVIPHPVYGPQSWLSVVNPGRATEDRTRALLNEAHDRARARYEKRRARGDQSPTSRSDDLDS
ncbi:MAG: DUF6194 family protein [Acidimicrobiia bacterium]